MPKLLYIYFVTVFAMTVILCPIDSVPFSLVGDLMGPGRPLFCLCNDNNHCITNKPPFTNGNSTNGPSNPIGRCETSHSGRCYTVKEVNLDSLKSSIIHRKRKSLMNESTPSIVSLASPLSTSNLSTTDLRDMFIRIRFGCLPSDERTTLTCNGHLSNHVMPKAILCCNSSDFCNAGAVPNFHHHKTDYDAINSALQNHNNRRMEIHQKRLLRLNPVMNIGPDLLTGGRPIKKSATEAHSKAHTAQDYPRVTRIVFIVAFVVVISTLTLTLICVFIVYKSGVRKHRQMMYDSVQWLPNRSPSKHQDYPSSKKHLLLNNGVTLRSSESCASKTKVFLEHIGNGPSVHTLSTESTRTTNTANEKPYTSDFSYDFVQQTLSKQVTLNQLLGCGRFSEVWSGSWRGEPVTVKLYPTHSRLADSIWRRVALLHRSMLLRHQSVQGLMAIDRINWPHQLSASSQRVLMIAEWIPLGSLKDLMAGFCWVFESRSPSHDRPAGCVCTCGSVRLIRRNDGDGEFGDEPLLASVNAQSFATILLRMAHSLTQGLCFLHTEFAGTRGKPALAHRDLKPSNVLVRPDWTCCLADLGLALRPLPAGLPVSQPDLHCLYARYVDRVLDCPAQQGLECPPPQRDTAQVAATPDSSGNFGTAGQPILAGLSLEEVEQLDWWPVGGLQAGTPRYLAPELLTNSIDPFCFTAHQKADIYALGLVMWELSTWALTNCQNRPGGALVEVAKPNPSPTAPLITEATIDRPAVTSNPPNLPVFQEEWQLYLGQNGLEGCTTCDWYAHGTLNRTSPQSTPHEPDIPAMHHLVSSLRLQPRLPLLPAWLDCRCHSLNSCSSTGHPGLQQKLLQAEDDDQGVELASEGGSERLQSDSRHPRVSSAVADLPVASASSSASSTSSSGASSLHNPLLGDSDSRPSLAWNPRLGVAIGQLTALLPECWSQNPDARLTALRVRKNLQRIADQLEAAQPLQHQKQQTAALHRPGQHTTVAVLVLQSPNADVQQCGNSSSSATVKAV